VKHVGNAYGRVASLLREYLKPLGMLCEAGPLRVMRELTAGVVFTGSVQLTNAARLFASTPKQWVLLTSGLIGHRVGPRQVRYDYALRWRAEDGKRFLGQVCRVERFLTGSFLALERMLWCVSLAGGFLSYLQREEPSLSEQLQQEVLYWDKEAVLPVYRLARGLHALTTRSGPATLAVNA
jgi:hypothetical protein